jgi:hypothetical protein
MAEQSKSRSALCAEAGFGTYDQGEDGSEVPGPQSVTFLFLECQKKSWSFNGLSAFAAA